MMKYLLVLAVLFVALQIWRARRRPPSAPPRAPGAADTSPQDMVACAHCGLHLPRSDAVHDAGHSYCSAEHQRQGPV